MFWGYVRLLNAIEDTPALGGGPARESETPGQVERASERVAFEASRRRNLGDPLAPDAPVGDISRSIEEQPPAHTPRYPERHIAGGPYGAMAPGVAAQYEYEYERPGSLNRAARYAGRGAASVVRWAGTLRNMRDIQPAGARSSAERYIAEHPSMIGAAAVAGFLLGRLLRR